MLEPIYTFESRHFGVEKTKKRKGVNELATELVWKYVGCDPNKCTGCGVCEYICSLEKENTFNPYKSRIKSVRVKSLVNVSIACRFCIDPPCMSACAQKALTQSEETGVIEVDENKCTACGWCIQACEHGAIKLISGDHGGKSVVAVCDLCDGEPKCIDWCPEEALELITHDIHDQKIRIAPIVNMYKRSYIIS